MTRLRSQSARNAQDGATLMEFSIAATVFFLALFGVLEMGRLLWTHNALTEAVRKGARYAVLNKKNDPITNTQLQNVQNLVVYGTPSPAAGASPVIPGLTTAMVTATYSGDFGVKLGTATITITGYTFNFSVPLFGTSITLPTYKSTMTGESAGT